MHHKRKNRSPILPTVLELLEAGLPVKEVAYQAKLSVKRIIEFKNEFFNTILVRKKDYDPDQLPLL